MDEMSIKKFLQYCKGKDKIFGLQQFTHPPIASHVMVFFLRGLYGDWKQPAGYFYVGNSIPPAKLKEVILENIAKLLDVGLKVRTLTSDQGSDFYSSSNLLGVSQENPFFFVNGSKVFYIYDSPHLLKSTRNNLLKNVFSWKSADERDHSASWSHIEKFYNLDKFSEVSKATKPKKTISLSKIKLKKKIHSDQNVDSLNSKKKKHRLAPKLSRKHIEPTSFERMRVKFATQVFSDSVAAGMMTMVTRKQLGIECMDTIELIKNMNRLFDLMNSSNSSNAFKGSVKDIFFLNSMVQFFNNLQIHNSAGKNVTKILKCCKGWCITINAILQLFEDLKNDYRFLMTRRLCQDCLELFFGQIRSQNGDCRNPTAYQFYHNFKKLFAIRFMLITTSHTNCESIEFCEQDSISFFSIMRDFKLKQIVEDNVENVRGCSLLKEIQSKSGKKIVYPDKNSLTFFSGILYEKCLKVHDCVLCKQNVECKLSGDSMFTFFKVKQSQESLFGDFIVPNKSFVAFIGELDNVFSKIFCNVAGSSNLSNELYKILCQVDYHNSCDKFPKEFLLKHYIKYKIFDALSFYNNELMNKWTHTKNVKLRILSNI